MVYVLHGGCLYTTFAEYYYTYLDPFVVVACPFDKVYKLGYLLLVLAVAVSVAPGGVGKLCIVVVAPAHMLHLSCCSPC